MTYFYTQEGDWEDYNTVLATIQNGHAHALSCASAWLQDNFDIVIAAVRTNGYVLEHASQHLQGDFDIVMAAVTSAGSALQFASKELQGNYDIVMAAVHTPIHTDGRLPLVAASDDLQRNFAINLAAVSNHGHWLGQLHVDLQSNLDIVVAAMRNDGSSLAYALEKFQDNAAVVSVAIANDKPKWNYWNDCGIAFKHASGRLRDNFEMALTAVSYDCKAAQFVSARLATNCTLQALLTCDGHARAAFRLAQQRTTGVAALQMAQSAWAPCRHFMYQGRVSTTIQTTLLAAQRVQSNHNLWLPIELWLFIIRFFTYDY
jgi:hypothetical protein